MAINSLMFPCIGTQLHIYYLISCREISNHSKTAHQPFKRKETRGYIPPSSTLIFWSVNCRIPKTNESFPGEGIFWSLNYGIPINRFFDRALPWARNCYRMTVRVNNADKVEPFKCADLKDFKVNRPCKFNLSFRL